MQHDRFKSILRVSAIVSGTSGRTSPQLPRHQDKTDGQAGHAAACPPTHGDTDDFALNVLTGYPMAILSVNGETDGRETC